MEMLDEDRCNVEDVSSIEVWGVWAGLVLVVSDVKERNWLSGETAASLNAGGTGHLLAS